MSGDRAGRVTIVDTPENTEREASSVLTVRDMMRSNGMVEGDEGRYECRVTNRLPRDVQIASTNITVTCEWVKQVLHACVSERNRVTTL